MTEHFTLAQCLISLSLIGIIWFHLFGKLRRDDFRSKIRRIRDDVFDYVWQNGHSFDDANYKSTRQLLNGIIRMSRTLTPTTFMLIFVSGTAMSRNQRKCTDPPKTDLDKRLHEAHQEAVKAMVHFVYCEGLTRIFMRVVFWIVKLSRLPFALKYERSRTPFKLRISSVVRTLQALATRG